MVVILVVVGRKREREREERDVCFFIWEILMDALRVIVNNLFKENFYGKRKKKVINVLTAFSISHKSGVKTFLKWIVNHYPKSTC